METPDGKKDFDNLRVFIRTDSGWKLMAWANEAA
jgi:hypothetical protein